MNKKYLSIILAGILVLVTACVQSYAEEKGNKVITQVAQFSKAYKRCLEVQKTNEMIKAYKNGEMVLTADQIADIKARYAGYLDEAFQEINKPENEFYISYLLKTSGLLPENVSATVKNIIAIAKLDISTNEKLDLLMATNSTCTNLVDVFVKCLGLGLFLLFAAVVFNFVGVIPNIALIGGILANLNFILALVAAALYPFFCLF